jgi:FAD/FMN-containing dehydrogenase
MSSLVAIAATGVFLTCSAEHHMNSLTYFTLDRDVRQLRSADVEALAARISGGLITAWRRRLRGRAQGLERHRRPPSGRDRALPQRARRAGGGPLRGRASHAAQRAQRRPSHRRQRRRRRRPDDRPLGDACVDVDAAKRTARVGAGALLKDFDAAAQAHGLATPLGINSTTGVAGLTLGGGFGWLTRLHGLTIDNLLSARVVMADGSVRTASAREEPELFWALRGGGGNFGVVTSFEFALHPVGPEIYAGFVVYPFAQARQVLRAWRDFCATAPDALSVWTVMRKAPPLPFLPASAHGTDVVILPIVYAGDMEAGKRACGADRTLRRPDRRRARADAVRRLPGRLRSAAHGGRPQLLEDEQLRPTERCRDRPVDRLGRQPAGGECEIFVAQLGGAMARVPADATAFVGRDARFIMNVHGRWSEPADDGRVRDWARSRLQRDRAARHGRRLRQLPDRGRRRAGRGELRRQPPAPAGAEAPLRSGQPVPDESQHRAGGRVVALVAVSRLDHRGCTVSGAEPAALEAFERALAAYQGWRDGAEAPLALALEEAPRFVMAHVLQAYLLVCSRDPRRVAMARPTLARAAALPANERERLHVAAIAALLDDDDFEAARATLGELLRLEPRDALALQAAHSLDYVSGDAQCMKERVATVLPAWSTDLPGYHAILAMHAFSLEESGRYEEAEASARAALALDPLDAARITSWPTCSR